VRGLSAEEKALLIKFATGTSRLPVGGFAKLDPPFMVAHKPFEARQPLPTAATCFRMLKLPEYPTYKDLERNLLLAIRCVPLCVWPRGLIQSCCL
jgi:hypothetical protein